MKPLDSTESCGLACRVETHSLVQLYSSKTDDELLALAADSLVEEARPILASEIRRRDLVVLPTEVKRQAITAAEHRLGKFFRAGGEFLLNSVVAVVGTAMMESTIWSKIGPAHSVSGVPVREWLLGLYACSFPWVFRR